MTDMETDFGAEFEPSSLTNEFTGSKRESTKPPGIDEPICLISYEVAYILLGGGPDSRTGFWKAYRRELDLNLKTEYRNYHVSLCRHQLVSLRMTLTHPIYFRNKRLTTERPVDPFTLQALTEPRFN